MMTVKSGFTECEVYWGSHGCHHPRLHSKDIPHECDCCECPEGKCEPGCVAKTPYYGPETNFYGADVKLYGLREHE